MLNDDLGQPIVAMAELSLAGAVADASMMLLNKPEPVVETARPIRRMCRHRTKRLWQVAMRIVGSRPGDASKAVSSIEIVDECLVVDICVDRYLWRYQRTPKEDSIKELDGRRSRSSGRARW